MTVGLIVCFHRYPPYYKDNYRIIFEYFKKQFRLWGHLIDRLYFVDSQGYLHTGEESYMEGLLKARVIHTENHSHGMNLNVAFQEVKEDITMIIDMDTIIYDAKVLQKQLDIMKNEFPGPDVMAYIERPDPERISRFAPYYFIGMTEFMKKVPVIDFREAPPEHLDPLAKLTHDMIHIGVRYQEIDDDRSSIRLLRDGRIVKDIKKGPTGSYHIRNFNGGIHINDTWLMDEKKAKSHIDLMPCEELTRILAWNWVLNSHTIKSDKLNDTIRAIIGYKGIHEDRWDIFIHSFYQYHDFMKL